MIPPGQSIEAELARYEQELRQLHHEALASELTRADAEKKISASLEAKQRELVLHAQFLSSLDVLW